MAKFLRITLYSLLGGALLGILLLAAVFLVQPERYAAFVEQSLVGAARQAGVPLSMSGSELTPTRYTAHHLKIFFPQSFIFFAVESLQLSPEILSCLLLSPRLRLDAKLYGGQGAGVLHYSLRQRRGEASLSLSGLDIAAHPQLAGLGIRSGLLHVDIQDLTFDSAAVQQARVTVHLQDAEKPQKTILPLKNFGLPINIEIPALTDINFDAAAVFSAPLLEISELHLRSSLGEVRAKGKVSLLDPDNNDALLIDGTVELSEEGQALLGQYLPLLTSGALDETTRRWRIFLKGSARLPLARFSKL